MGFETNYNLYIVLPVACNALENLKKEEENLTKEKESKKSFMETYFQDERFFLDWDIKTGQKITLPKVLLPELQNLPEGYKLIYVEFIFKYTFSKEVKGFVDLFVKLTKNQMILAVGNTICDEYDVYTDYEVLFVNEVGRGITSPSQKFKDTVILIGNPGVGKSTILNGLVGQVLFRAGLSIGKGMTTVLQEEICGGRRYLDTPGLSDIKMRRQAAEEITRGIRKGGIFRIFFVMTLEAGRVRLDDTIIMRLVLEAAPEIKNNYSIILNKASKKLRNQMSSGDSVYREMLAMLNEGLPFGTTKIFANADDAILHDEDDMLPTLSLDLLSFINEASPVTIHSNNVADIQTDQFEKIREELSTKKLLDEDLQPKLGKAHDQPPFLNSFDKVYSNSGTEYSEIATGFGRSLKIEEERKINIENMSNSFPTQGKHMDGEERKSNVEAQISVFTSLHQGESLDLDESSESDAVNQMATKKPRVSKSQLEKDPFEQTQSISLSTSTHQDQSLDLDESSESDAVNQIVTKKPRVSKSQLDKDPFEQSQSNSEQHSQTEINEPSLGEMLVQLNDSEKNDKTEALPQFFPDEEIVLTEEFYKLKYQKSSQKESCYQLGKAFISMAFVVDSNLIQNPLARNELLNYYYQAYFNAKSVGLILLKSEIYYGKHGRAKLEDLKNKISELPSQLVGWFEVGYLIRFGYSLMYSKEKLPLKMAKGIISRLKFIKETGLSDKLISDLNKCYMKVIKTPLWMGFDKEWKLLEKEVEKRLAELTSNQSI